MQSKMSFHITRINGRKPHAFRVKNKNKNHTFRTEAVERENGYAQQLEGDIEPYQGSGNSTAEAMEAASFRDFGPRRSSRSGFGAPICKRLESTSCGAFMQVKTNPLPSSANRIRAPP